jgi:hypothetical protein
VIRPWSEIRDFYKELAGTDAQLVAMLRLVEQIESSRYARALYPWTSMCDLCVAQFPAVYPDHYPYLRISPISGGNIEFRYLDTAVENRQWHRVVSEVGG